MIRGSLSTLVMAGPAGRRRIVLENQGLLGIAFFEASAFVILLVLFSLFRREQHGGYFRFWHAGWFCFTFSALFEVMFLVRPLAGLHLAGLHLAGLHLLAVHLLAVYLRSVHLTGVYLLASTCEAFT